MPFSAIRKRGKSDPPSPPRATTEPRTPPQYLGLCRPPRVCWFTSTGTSKLFSSRVVLLLSLPTLLGSQRARFWLPKRLPLHCMPMAIIGQLSCSCIYFTPHAQQSEWTRASFRATLGIVSRLYCSACHKLRTCVLTSRPFLVGCQNTVCRTSDHYDEGSTSHTQK